MERERRLVFGEVAELYDARRPSYPAELVDDLTGWAEGSDGPARALEVGAGTGKATRLVAARGVMVVAIEPNREMAALVRRSTPEPLEVIEADFETAELDGRRFPLLFAAQSWHWVDPATGYARARAALEPGGRLVPFWNRPQWSVSDQRAALSEAYAAHAPELDQAGSMHPDAPDDAGEEGFWGEAIAAAPGFTDPTVRAYRWSTDYTTESYPELLATMSAIRLLAPERRARLLDAVAETIAAAGGGLRLPMLTVACVARAVAPDEVPQSSSWSSASR